MKTKDAFALRDFDATRILQRPYFRKFNLPVGDDEEVVKNLSCAGLDLQGIIAKKVVVGKLINCAEQYLSHVKRHAERLKKLTQIYAEKYIAANDDIKIKAQYQRAVNLRGYYHDLYHNVLNPFLGEIGYYGGQSTLFFLHRCRADFGQRLKQARKAAGLTQAELAERVGLKTYAPITQYERGINDPSLPTLISFATELKCSADWLLGLD